MVYGNVEPMDKTTIYLPKEQHDALEEISRRTGRPQAQLIREALAVYLAGQERPRPKTIGIVSKETVSSSDVEEWLKENWKPDW
jgi:hypothetical protein